MPRLKPFLMILPFLFAGLGAFVLAGMLTSRPEPEHLPLAYVIHNIIPENTDTYDLRVMDVLSGAVVFEVNSPEYDCPIGISPDERWLLYGQSDNEIWNQRYTLVDINSGESRLVVIGTGIVNIHWEDEHFIYESYDQFYDEHFVQRYDIVKGMSEYLTMRDFPEIEQQWIEDVTTLNIDGILRLYNVDTQEMKTYQLANTTSGTVQLTDWSLDEQYVVYMVYDAVGTDDEHYSLYVLDTTTGVSSEVQSRWSTVPWYRTVIWLDSTHFVYMHADSDSVNAASHSDDYLHRPYSDLWMYDVATGELVQLTDTPAIDENFRCGFG